MSAPDRNICGKISSGHADRDGLGVLRDPDDEDAERATGEGQDRGERDDPQQVAGVHRDLHDEDHRDDADERDQLAAIPDPMSLPRSTA